MITKIGAIYHPEKKPGYAYLCVRFDRETDSVTMLQLWIDRGVMSYGASSGTLWETMLSALEDALVLGSVVEYMP